MIINKAINHYPTFVKEIFSKSVDVFKANKWVGGHFVDDISDWYGNNKLTVRVSARDHMKSMSFYAHIMWKIFRMYHLQRGREIQYFSYKQSMASYHIAKIKEAMACNPYFVGLRDLTLNAKGVIRCTWLDKKTYEQKRIQLTVTPRGLLEFKRGIHSQDIYIDDPFQDPENMLEPTKVIKINDVMKKQILDMFQEELHIAGTAQTDQDFYFDKDFTHRFAVRIDPAEKDPIKKLPLWPEWLTWEELMSKKKERGERVYNQEYLCKPVYAENAFIKMDRLLTVVNPNLKNYNVNEWQKDNPNKNMNNMIGGWDLGKKNHPAHFTIFECVGDVWVQRLERWFDNEDYLDQLAFIDNAIEVYGLDKVYFDSTRGELDVMIESGELAGEYVPIHFTLKIKTAMATMFDKMITNNKIQLLQADRMLNQICIVNSDLKAPSTKQGHADSFWSICLTMNFIINETLDIYVV